MKKFTLVLALTLFSVLCLGQILEATISAECEPYIQKNGSLVQAYNIGAVSVYYPGGYCVAEMEVWLVDLDSEAENTGSLYHANWNGASGEGPIAAHLTGVSNHHYIAYCYSMGTVYDAAHSPQHVIEQFSDDENAGPLTF
ncbi:MAG TPA: hypothetical protein PKZ83_17350 [bacterium]|nr:hypothetical protein [bacterium]HQJ66583.1 hypothetical protein [bacterium]